MRKISMDGFYVAYLTGRAGTSMLMLVISHGTLVGGGMKYDGTIVQKSDASGYLCSVVYIIPPGIPLITGAPPAAEPQRIPLQFELPLNFADKRVITIETPLGAVNAKFEKNQGPLRILAMPAGAETFWSLKLSDVINFLILVATIVAIYFGPIKAVEISRRNDEIREAARRKREIFAPLMRTRRAAMTADHVWALNLIQLEFATNDAVVRAHKEYIANLYEVAPEPGPALDAFIQRRTDRFFDLLHEIAKAVGCNADKRDLERAGYVPSGWFNEQSEISIFRSAMIDLLHGRRPLPVAPFQPQGAANPFPPPPGGSLQPPNAPG
jgi:hypothetical protein